MQYLRLRLTIIILEDILIELLYSLVIYIIATQLFYSLY